MKESLVRDTLLRVQDIVLESTGVALCDKGRERLEDLLQGLAGSPMATKPGENFSHREVTILLADLRGFTAMTASYPAGVVLELLNRCFVSMSEIIVRHHGTIDKFMGDAIMVIFFGDPASRGEDVKRALLCAVDMQIGMEWLNRGQKKANMPEIFMGIGINTGKVMAGLLGSDVYSAYTVIGEDVNLASRIEAFSLRGQVLISEGTHNFCSEYARTGEPMEVYVKGRPERVRLRELLGIPSLGREVPRQETRRSPRVDVRVPFTYQQMRNKIVYPQQAAGVILDIGYYGVLAELDDPELPLYSEVKLEMDLPLVGYRARDLYARIVKVVRKGERTHFGLEFTSAGAEANGKIQLFVQMLIQGTDAEHGEFIGRQR